MHASEPLVLPPAGEFLPACIGRLPDKEVQDVAEAILGSLRSMSLMVPPLFRLERCPSDNLSKRKAALILNRVNGGYGFVSLNAEFDVGSVRFVGIAAGTLMAIRHGALNSAEKSVFDQKFRQFVEALSNGAVAAIPVKRRLFQKYLNIIRQAIGRETEGAVAIKRSNGFWYQENTVGHLRMIQAFGALAIDEHPMDYRELSGVTW